MSRACRTAIKRILLLATVMLIAPLPQYARAVSVGEGEAKKCEEA